MLELSKDNFEKEIKGLVVVDFWAGWCNPCKMLTPVFEKVSKQIKAKFAKVNIEENKELAEEYSVMGIPCIIVFSKGKEIDRWTGFMPEEELKKKIEQALTKA